MGIEGPFFKGIEVNHSNIVEAAIIERYLSQFGVNFFSGNFLFMLVTTL